MTSFKRTQRKYVQKAYRVRNWREYETGLRARGSLTVWLGLTDGKLANWNSPRPTRRKPGRQRQYSNHAIETTVTLGLVFGLASRQTEGFLRSLLTLLNLDNDVPDHSTISRRKARLGKGVSYERRTVKPVHLLIDSSGLSVHVGQWRTPPKARDYRKLHLAVDEHTSDVVACELTSKRARDASRVASLVGQIERPIASAKADAAYDTGDVYTTLENHRAHRSPKVLIPPRKGAQLALDSAGTRQRNRNIRARSRVGKRKWYVASGSSRRSKVETTFHRYKAILGSAMRARGLASQRVEVRLGCKILNTMTALGIPVKGGTKLDQMAEENQTTWPLGRVSENGCAKGGVRMVERQRRGGRACCVRDDSCRRSAPGCGRDESADRAARQSAVRSRRSRSIR